MKSDHFYMQLALKEAEAAYAEGEIPVGAVIVDAEGNILSAAHNEREAAHDATAHAEIKAIRMAGNRLKQWRLSNCTLYVTLEPCPMCAGAIVMSRISRIVYGLPESKTGSVESIFNIPGHPSLNQNVEIRAGVMEDECRDLIQRFFRDKR